MTAGAAAGGADNAAVWDGARRGHYEVWFLTLNHRPSRTGFWIRYTMESPLAGRSEPWAQLWFAAFDAGDPARNFGVNRRFPIAALRTSASPFEVRIGESVLGPAHARGALAGDGHQARWDLAWVPAPAPHRHLPGLIYRTPFADTRLSSPNLDVPVSGTIEVDGRVLTLDGERGDQTHVWGRKHAHAWAWGHCGAFEGPRRGVLEALTVRLKRRGVVLPPLTLLTLFLDGRAYCFNGLTDLLRARGAFATARYRFATRGRGISIEGEFACRPEDMILAEYADPDGEASFCANTEVADLRVRLRGPGRADAETLVARGTAHFEVAARVPDPAIARRHVTAAR